MAEWFEPGSPVRSWRAWLQLVVGLAGFGVAVSLMVRSGLGLGPWDAFHAGLANRTGISIGAASIIAGVLIVAGSWFIGVRPGVGTLANMLLIGLFIDLTLPVMPQAANWLVGGVMYVVAILVCGLSTGFYMAPGLGKGPRDGLIVGLCRRTGRSIRLVRTLVELSALGLGWGMGGPVGVGTLLFTFGIGPAMQWGMRVCGVETARTPSTAEA
ncbi:MAG TPA: hypothetical protein VF665_06900 [Longimicrobium sp.]|jgi:uncharacterized membrane protein YczE|uniref:YczE/YyaS/YitT family protein n=1 Tax=Longimicrobium sp. TaxID=2029185 RepID=UPI002ED8795D